MTNDTESADNLDRLLTHLKNDSFAARLVRARRGPEASDPAAAMKAVLLDRLAQVRKKIEDPET